MNAILETVHGDLTKDRGQGVVDLAHDHRQTDLWSALRFHQAGKREHLSEDGRSFRHRQGRLCLEQTLLSRQALMHTVSQFVCERLNISKSAAVVHQYVGVGTGNSRVTEGPSDFSRIHRCVYTFLLEEICRDRFEDWMKGFVGLQDNTFRLIPCVKDFRFL